MLPTFIDWVTVTFTGDNEECQGRIHKVLDDLDVLAKAGSTGHFSSRISNNGFKGRPAKMHIDVSGYLAHVFARTLSAAFMQACVTRLDFRGELDITHSGFKSIQQQLVAAPRDKYQVTTHSSRTRLKAARRDAGGVWFGVGSFKSGRCLRTYIRANEGGAVEVHLQDEPLQKLFARAYDVGKSQGEDERWLRLLTAGDDALEDMLLIAAQKIGKDQHEFVKELCQATIPVHDHAMRILWEARDALRAAGYTEDNEVYRAITWELATDQERVKFTER